MKLGTGISLYHKTFGIVDGRDAVENLKKRHNLTEN